MKSRPSSEFYANPFLLWGTLGVKAMQMSTAAAQVIAIRTARMAAAGLHPSAADRREMTLMGAEKVDAFSRAGQALATGAVPLVAGMAAHAVRSGFDLFHATAQLAASRTAAQTLERQRRLADTLIRSTPGAPCAGTGARQGDGQRPAAHQEGPLKPPAADRHGLQGLLQRAGRRPGRQR
jgi:hypothetical protein